MNRAAKTKTAYFCQSCGYESAKWLGKCPSCESWNSFAEEVIVKGSGKAAGGKTGTNRVNQPVKISEIEFSPQYRISTADAELDRVLGGGIVPGSLVLLGGEPGIGKSTLLLQVAMQLPLKILYVSGEESQQQIRLRANRLQPGLNEDGNSSVKVNEGPSPSGIGAAELYILTETSTQHILKQAEQLEPQLVIIDSVQTLYSAHIESTPGSVSQVRECTAELLRFSKESHIPVFMIGHITKDGLIAGPKILEHMVDTVLQFEGDRHHTYRILRAIKNRFGAAAELGVYEMQGNGMRGVNNPSEVLLSQREEALSGVAVSVTLEGIRPMLIETQALVSPSVYGTPQRSATGFDSRRMNMLLAVLEKRCGFRLGMKDVFLNITGGIRIDDPAIDLGLVCSIISSHEDIPLSPHCCFAGEVGLSGEIRAVNRVEQRIAEAEKLGFETLYISRYNRKELNLSRYKIEVIAVGKIEEVIGSLFG